MIKAVFVDMDGTLLTDDKRVTEKNAQAIREFQERGGLFVINTGRDYQAASMPVREVGIFCDYLCLSGACVYEADGHCVKSDTIDREDLEKIRALEKKYDLYGLYLAGEGKYTSWTRESCAAHYVKEEQILSAERGDDPTKVTTAQFDRILDHITYEQDIDGMIRNGLQVFKIAILGMDQGILMKAKEELKSWEHLKIASSAHTNIEINSDRVDKGQSAADYAAEKGILPSEIMVIGDSENDIAMFGFPFGKTVAMGNAEESIKALCTDVTLSNEEDGVAYALEQWAFK